MNGYSIGLSMLFLRISSDHIQAYTNVCPHQGTQNQWSLQSGNIFRCANHNYSFDSTCETSSSLPCYSTNIDGDNILIDPVDLDLSYQKFGFSIIYAFTNNKKEKKL